MLVPSVAPQYRSFFLIAHPPPTTVVPLPVALRPGGRVRLIAIAVAQARPVAAVTEPGDGQTQRRANTDIIDIMAIVLAATDSDHSSADQRRNANQRAAEVAAIAEDAQLPRQEQRQVSQAREAETRVTGGERPPAVVQGVVVGLGADVDGDEDVAGGAGAGLAAGDEVRAGPPHGVLHDVGQERGEDQADGQPEDGAVLLVEAGAGARHDGVPGEQDAEGREQRVHEIQPHRDALDLGVREGDAQVVDVEHAVEGLDEELD